MLPTPSRRDALAQFHSRKTPCPGTAIDVVAVTLLAVCGWHTLPHSPQLTKPDGMRRPVSGRDAVYAPKLSTCSAIALKIHFPSIQFTSRRLRKRSSRSEASNSERPPWSSFTAGIALSDVRSLGAKNARLRMTSLRGRCRLQIARPVISRCRVFACLPICRSTGLSSRANACPQCIPE